MADNASDLVSALRLETEFLAGCVIHSQGSREIWDIGNEIGRGTFGEVRLYRLRQSGSSVQSVRAVKQVRKATGFGHRWDYLRELEVMARFSQPCVGTFLATRLLIGKTDV
jgi:hypothetical protein